jgi:hypothetical protein
VTLAHLESAANKLGICLSGEGLGTLDWCSNGAVDNELRKDSESAGDSKEDRVIVGFGETVVLEKNTGVGVNVGVWVLGLAVLGEDTWGNLVDLADKVEHWVIWKMLLGKLALGNVTWICLAENGVSITWNDLTSLEGAP